MKTIHITKAFLEKAAAAKNDRPSSARVQRRTTYADVAYRDWSDHYDIYQKDGTWLCSFTDGSQRGMPRFENIKTRNDIRVSFPS